MARKPLRPCHKVGCPNLTRTKYCKEHEHLEAENKRERDKFYDMYKRDKKAQAFYNSKAWERLRNHRMILDHGLCQHCLKKKRIVQADVVDHIIPIKVRWDLRLSLDNTQALCNACHAVKTAEDKRKYGVGAGGKF